MNHTRQPLCGSSLQHSGNAGDRIPVRAIQLAAVILTPCRFVSVLMEQVAADPIILADFRAAEPREIRLGLVHVRAIFGFVLNTVIDTTHVVGCLQALPSVRFVRMNNCARSDVLSDQRHRIALARHNERPGATVHFADHNHDLALASLFLS